MSDSDTVDRITRSNSTSLKATNMDKICIMLKQLQLTVDANQKKSDERFASLETKLSSQTEVWKSEINNVLANHLKVTETRIDHLASKLSSFAGTVEEKMESLDRQNRLNDVLIRGIPTTERENIFHLYEKLAKVLKFPYETMYVVNSIFRLNKNNVASNMNLSPPILLKFATPILKRAFFNQYLKFQNLRLSDIGFTSTERIYINDNLTKKNSMLYKKAIEMKSAKQIDKLQVRNGLIFVKNPHSENFVKINSIKDLRHSENDTQLQSTDYLNKTMLQFDIN